VASRGRRGIHAWTLATALQAYATTNDTSTSRLSTYRLLAHMFPQLDSVSITHPQTIDGLNSSSQQVASKLCVLQQP
jgi:hypothetical protein